MDTLELFKGRSDEDIRAEARTYQIGKWILRGGGAVCAAIGITGIALEQTGVVDELSLLGDVIVYTPAAVGAFIGLRCGRIPAQAQARNEAELLRRTEIEVGQQG